MLFPTQPTEDSAHTALQILKQPEDTLPDPRLRQTARAHLNTYAQPRRAAGRPLFPTYQRQANAAHQEKLRSYFLTEDLADLFPPDRAALYRSQLAAHPEPQRFAARVANTGFLKSIAAAAKVPFNAETYEPIRNAYAIQHLGIKDPAQITDETFYNTLRTRFQTEAANETLVQKTLSDFYTANLTGELRPLPTFPETLPIELRDKASQQALILSQEARRQRRKLEPLATRLASELLALRSETQTPAMDGLDQTALQSISVEAAMPAAIGRAFQQLPADPRDRAITLALLARQVQTWPEDTRSVFSRSLGSLARGTVQFLEGVGDFAFAADRQILGQPESGTRGPDIARARTELREFQNLIRDADPLKKATDTFLQTGTLGLFQSLPYTLSAFAGPYGMGMMAASFAGQSITEQAIASPETTETARFLTGSTTGVVESATETFINRTGARLLAGRVPTTYGILNKLGIQSRTARAALGGAIATGAATGIEFGEEVIQDSSRALAADIARELSGLAPQTDWSAFFKGWIDLDNETTYQTLAATTVFGLVGGGIASFSHFKYGDYLRKNRAVLHALGVPEARIEEIATGTDLAKVDQAFKETFEQGLEARTADQRAAALQVLRELHTATAAAGLPRITAEQEFGSDAVTYRFTDPITQESQDFDTEEEALNHWRDWGMQHEAEVFEKFEALSETAQIDTLTQEGAASEETEVRSTQKTRTLTDEQAELRAAEQQTQTALDRETRPALRADLEESLENTRSALDTIQARITAFVLQHGPASAAKLGNFLITGKRWAERTRSGLTRYIIQLYGGRSVQDVFEEFAEDAFVRALDAGLVNPTQILADIRRFEETTGQTLIDPSYQYTGQETALPLIEAFSALARAYAIQEVPYGTLPPEVSQWIQIQTTAFTDAATEAGKLIADLRRAGAIRQSLQDQTLSPALQDLLTDAIGINEQARLRRLEKKHQAQLAAEAMEGFPEIRESLAGQLPHPQTLTKNRHPLAGEVRSLYETLLRPSRRKDKAGRAVLRTNEANAFFLPPGQMEDLDLIRRRMNELGYAFDTPADMLDALTESLAYNKPHYATGSPLDSFGESFSITPIDPTQPGGATIGDAASPSASITRLMDFKLENPPAIPSDYLEAWEYGKKFSELSVTEAALKTPDWVFNFGLDTQEFYEAGRRGENPEYVVGFRFGPIPDRGRSTNWADNTAEPGVSLAYAHKRTDMESSALTMMGVSSREKTYVEGWAFPVSRWGSDGEIVIVGARQFDPFNQSAPPAPGASISPISPTRNSELGTSYSITPPPTTQQARPLAEPGLVEASPAENPFGQSAQSALTSFNEAAGDAQGVTYSITRAREIYRTAQKNLQAARETLSALESQISIQRMEWELAHGTSLELPPEAEIYSASIRLSSNYSVTENREKGPVLQPDGNRSFGFTETPAAFIARVQKILNHPNHAGSTATWFAEQKTGLLTVPFAANQFTGPVEATSPGFDFAPFTVPDSILAAREALAQAQADLYVAEQDFDPQAETRIAEAEQQAAKLRQQFIRSRAAQFAAAMDAQYGPIETRESFIGRVWQAFARHDEIFQYGKTTSPDAADIAAAVSTPQITITARQDADSITFSHRDGQLTIEATNTARPYITATQAGSSGKKSGQGSRLYQAALDWIHNNGKRIKDDPAGLTAINQIRRTSNFLASALRWGTTRHLKPHAKQAVGKWTRNDVINTALLATKEMENAFQAIPSAQKWTFGFSNDTFQDADGNTLTLDDLENTVAAAVPGTSGIGLSTLQRALITSSALQEFQRGTTESLVQTAESSLPSSLTGVSYSLSPASLVRHADLEAKHNAGTITPEETAEAQRMVDEAAKKAGYNRKGVRFGFYVNGVPLPPSIGNQNFGPGYYIAEDAENNIDAEGVSVSPEINRRSLEEAGLVGVDVEFRKDVVFVKAKRPLVGNLPVSDRPLLNAMVAYQSAVNDAYSALSRRGYMSPSAIAEARGASQLEASISSFLPDHQKYQRGVALLIKSGKIDYDSVRGMTGRKGMSAELVVQHPSQIKSAEPFTGVPLAQRFDPAQDSISYSLSPASLVRIEAAIARRLAAGPEARATFYSRLRDRLASLTQRLEDLDNGVGPFGRTATDDPVETERRRIQDAIAEARTIIDTLPPEARGRVPMDFADLTRAQTERGRVSALLRLIDKADEALEALLRQEYFDALESLIDLATPERLPNRQLKTRLTPRTQAQASAVVDAMALTPEAYAIELAKAQASLAAAEAAQPQTEEEATKAQETLTEAYLHLRRIETFGNIGGRTAAEMEIAYNELLAIYSQGRALRRDLEEAKRQENLAARKEILTSLGGEATQPEWAKRTEEKGFQDFLSSLQLGLSSFHQVMEFLFPESITARAFQDAIRAADRQFTRAKIDARQRFETHLSARWNLSGRSAGRRRNAILAQISKRRDDWNIEIREGSAFENESLTEEQAAAVLAGTLKPGWEKDPIAMESLRQALADFRLQRLAARRKDERFAKRAIKFQRLKGRKAPAFLRVSDLEALYLLQLHGQEMYRPALDRHGFTEAVIEKIRAKIDPRALDVGDFLSREYAAEYDRLNPVFRRLYQMDMPRIRNYAPGAFDNIASTVPLPQEDGQAGAVNAMSAGFTKSRLHHQARPRQENALALYWAHMEAVEYFIAFAEPLRQYKPLFNHPEVRRTMEARFGLRVVRDFQTWLDTLEVDGRHRAATVMGIAQMTANMAAGQSAAGLTLNIGTLFKQLSAAYGVYMEADLKDAIPATLRVLANPRAFRHIFETETVQQRILAGISPEDRRILEASRVSPSHLMHYLDVGRLPIAYTDAAFTTFSGTVAYEIGRAQAAKAGLTGLQAEAHALALMDRIVTKTAQPATTQDKSLAENTAAGIGKLLFLFKSDPRQKFAISTMALRQALTGRMSKGEAARRITFAWLLYGLTEEIVTDIWHTIARDEDDPDRWDVSDYIAAMLTGPISGVPIVGPSIEYAIQTLVGTGGFKPTTNPLEATAGRLFDQGLRLRTWKTITEQLEDPENPLTTYEILQAVNTDAALLAGLTYPWTPQAAALPVVTRTARDLWGIGAQTVDAFTPTDPRATMRQILDEEKEQRTTTRDSAAEARRTLLRSLENLTPAQAEARIAQLPEAQRAPLRRAYARRGMTPEERSLSALPTEARTRAILRILEALPPTQRPQVLTRLQQYFPNETPPE